jgi:TctA family transporter
MFPAIVLFCCIGTYSTGNTVFDVWVMLLFSVLGVFFYKVGAEPAPFVLGFVLGPLMEENFRRAMYRSRGDPMVFVERPISAVLLVLAIAFEQPHSSRSAHEARGSISGVETHTISMLAAMTSSKVVLVRRCDNVGAGTKSAYA